MDSMSANMKSIQNQVQQLASERQRPVVQQQPIHATPGGQHLTPQAVASTSQQGFQPMNQSPQPVAGLNIQQPAVQPQPIGLGQQVNQYGGQVQPQFAIPTQVPLSSSFTGIQQVCIRFAYEYMTYNLRPLQSETTSTHSGFTPYRTASGRDTKRPLDYAEETSPGNLFIFRPCR